MSTGAIAPIFNDPTYTTQPSNQKSTVGTGQMGQGDFLNLLITQLKNQNPLDPMKDTEFVSQLATFSSLDKMNTLTQTMQSTSAVSMIGKQVTTSKNLTGVVASMSVKSGTVYLNTTAGDQIAYSDVQNVTNPATTK